MTNNNMLSFASLNGNLEEVKKSLNSGANIRYGKDTPLYNACQNGHLDIVDYLLNSPDLKEHACDSTKNYEAFQASCLYNHLKVVDHLYNRYKNLSDLSFIDTGLIEGFYKTCQSGSMDVFHYLFSKVKELPGFKINKAIQKSIQFDSIDAVKFFYDDCKNNISLSSSINEALLFGSLKSIEFFIVHKKCNIEISHDICNSTKKFAEQCILLRKLQETTHFDILNKPKNKI